MIDNIKCFVVRKNEFEHFLNSSRRIDLKASTSLITGNIETYPLKGKFGNIDVVINEKKAYINGSLHKLENIVAENKEQNYDDFNFCQLKAIIEETLSYLHLDRNTSLSQLELGLNLHIPIDPKTFLDYNLLMHNFRDHNKNLRFRSKGDLKEFQLTDYHIKIYNKSKQCQLSDNILRVEIKIITKRLLRKLKAFCIEDLLKEKVLCNIFDLLLREIKKCTILDRFDPAKISSNDLEKLYKYTNPNYWLNLKTTKSEKVQTGQKKKFEEIAFKYNLLTTKQLLINLLTDKFWDLMNCTESQSHILQMAA